jgi:hypothetical protein
VVDQRWANNWDDHEGHVEQLEVRHVQPYEALKVYRCPGCDHEIPRGLGHEVVVPLDAPHDRRHWHTACWRRAERHGR